MLKTVIYGKNAVLPPPGAQSVADVRETVAAILADVRARGDDALREYTERFDGVARGAFEVTADEKKRALASLDPEFLAVLRRAKANIETYHKNQLRSGFVTQSADGAILGQLILPIERVGLYVPGGSAPLASVLLMNAVPAKLAGVPELIVVTPPGRDGTVSADILAAAETSGVDRVFAVGGAQAIAALAYGTASIPRVDKICGPGNAFVVEAKRQVFGVVGIEMLPGPSDICVVADETANPRFVAADMLAQAEHDRNARAVLVTASAELAARVEAELEAQLRTLPRAETAKASLETNGLIVLVSSLSEAMRAANAIAPEHLELAVSAPYDLLPQVKNAASVFLGHYAPEAFGDYLAGPNNTLPTYGTARFASPVSVDDFVKKTQLTGFSREAFSTLARDVIAFAHREKLDGHARSVEIRLGEDTP
ncbi:MAG: histidinol dehydrogenase [Oscillospiraceae bacterium]|jgi:histidinol dehydrogenase|nr:histidinol dehydrogenase [Oscillospiraceae bacterium]